MSGASIPAGAQGPWPAPAKLNLFLHITGRRDDGYHDLQTVFQFLDYADQLYFVPRADEAIHCFGGPPGVLPEADLCVCAARLLQQAAGIRTGVDIYNKKRLPAGAGLGGGSSDAATTLWALNRLWAAGLGTAALADLGLRLGADVPVFLFGRSAWAEGVG
ncbi:MAG: 4-(cytidine 5'-diphospho)-2-C-methyl-D-erythritol kinase, partial [Gammaproteobacteria bacterium]